MAGEVEQGAGHVASGTTERFRRFVNLFLLSVVLVLLFLLAGPYKSNAFGLRTPSLAVFYDYAPFVGFLIYAVYLAGYFLSNRYQWNNKVMGEITSDEPETAATSLMISFRRYAKTKRHYQTGILVSILAFYCAYLSLMWISVYPKVLIPLEFGIGVVIVSLSYVIGRYFKPAEVFMAKFMRMFYQVPATDPMSEEAINRHVNEKLEKIKAKHPSWFS